MRTITIGDKPLKEITQEELSKIVVIEGCIPFLTHWSEPIVTGFSNTASPETVVIEYFSINKTRPQKSDAYTFFLNVTNFSFHYSGERSGRRPGARLCLKSINYLINCGYDIPLTMNK